MLRDWLISDAAQKHMLHKHGVTAREVDEVMAGEPEVRRGKRQSGEQRYYVAGRTDAGRGLVVIFRMVGSIAEIKTAWDA